MNKKRVIIALVVFLAVVCGVMFLNRQAHYPTELVEAELAKYVIINEFSPIVCGFGVTVRSKPSYPAFVEKCFDWYHRYRANRKLEERHFIISENFVMITIYEKNDETYKIEIKSETEGHRDALDLQSNLAKAFPRLPCEVINEPK